MQRGWQCQTCCRCKLQPRLLVLVATSAAKRTGIHWYSFWQVRARCAEVEAAAAAADMRADALAARVAGAEERMRMLARQKAGADACCKVRAGEHEHM